MQALVKPARWRSSIKNSPSGVLGLQVSRVRTPCRVEISRRSSTSKTTGRSCGITFGNAVLGAKIRPEGEQRIGWIIWSNDPDQHGRSTAAKKGYAWHQDGFPTSKLPGSPPSFSAWRCARRRPVVRLVNAGCAGRADHWRQHEGRASATPPRAPGAPPRSFRSQLFPPALDLVPERRWHRCRRLAAEDGRTGAGTGVGICPADQFVAEIRGADPCCAAHHAAVGLRLAGYSRMVLAAVLRAPHR